MTLIEEIPNCGSGIGYRPELSDSIFEFADSIDFIEVLADKYIHGAESLAHLRGLSNKFRVVPHGTGLSLGWSGAVDAQYLAGMRRVSAAAKAPYYSEHLSLTSVPGIDLGHLSPLQYSDELLDAIIRKTKSIQSYLGKPLVLENLTYIVQIPGSQYSEAEFLHRLTKATGCGLLLDLTNLYTNSVNLDFDAYAAIESYPLEHVVQVHLAGGRWYDGRLIDSHSELVAEEVWSLLEYLADRTRVRAALVEHDSAFPEFGLLLDQVTRARRILAKSRCT